MSDLISLLLTCSTTGCADEENYSSSSAATGALLSESFQSRPMRRVSVRPFRVTEITPLVRPLLETRLLVRDSSPSDAADDDATAADA